MSSSSFNSHLPVDDSNSLSKFSTLLFEPLPPNKSFKRSQEVNILEAVDNSKTDNKLIFFSLIWHRLIWIKFYLILVYHA